MMASERRSAILRMLSTSTAPLSASALASELGVSRQIIVGDIALLRAGGESIAATPRGYTLSHEDGMTAYTVACCHSAADMERELDIMVDNGCTVRDVIVEHPIYGQLAGSLELRSRYDVSQFVLRSRQAEALPLSSLTDGVHLHTLLCPDKNALERVKSELRAAGILFEDD